MTTVINKELGYIYGLDIGLDNIEDYVEYASNVTVELSDGVGTGSVVTTYRSGQGGYRRQASAGQHIQFGTGGTGKQRMAAGSRYSYQHPDH